MTGLSDVQKALDAQSPYANGYRGGFGTTAFPDGLDRDDERPSLAECDRDEAGL